LAKSPTKNQEPAQALDESWHNIVVSDILTDHFNRTLISLSKNALFGPSEKTADENVLKFYPSTIKLKVLR
jgi:hypothetical protein